MDTCRIASEVTAELTEYLDWGDELRRSGLHRQAMCYELFLDGDMPYDVMVRHFERQRTAAFRNHAGFLDKLKALPGKVKDVVKDQAGKFKQKIQESVQEALPELAKLKGIEDEHGIKAKKSLWQSALDKLATSVMDDYKESLAAIKDDPAAVEEFVGKLYKGAVEKAKQALAKNVPAFVVAGLLGGPMAIGAVFFRKALFRAAKAAIRAGDAILTRTLGDSYTEKKETVKEKAKDKTRQIVMGIVRKVVKSPKDGEKIGAGVGAMALALKAGHETKDALKAMHGYIEEKYGKTWADMLANILKALVIGGVVRAGAGAVGAVAEWFAEDPDMAELAASLKAGGQEAMGDEGLQGALGDEGSEGPGAEMSERVQGLLEKSDLPAQIESVEDVKRIMRIRDVVEVDGRVILQLHTGQYALDEDALAKINDMYQERINPGGPGAPDWLTNATGQYRRTDEWLTRLMVDKVEFGGDHTLGVPVEEGDAGYDAVQEAFDAEREAGKLERGLAIQEVEDAIGAWPTKMNNGDFYLEWPPGSDSDEYAIVPGEKIREFNEAMGKLDPDKRGPWVQEQLRKVVKKVDYDQLQEIMRAKGTDDAL